MSSADVIDGDAATLAARLGHEELSEPDLAAVGAAVAGWHAAAPAGEAAPFAHVVEETLVTLAEAGAPARRLAGLARFCRAALAAFGGDLERRARAGHVRAGHGDLLAEHVLLGERVTAVDAGGLGIDVGYDLASLVMDVARTHDALSRALVRGYRAAGGDPGPEALLAFFCTVRALERAKIELLRAGRRADAAARADEQLALAERFAWRVRSPRLVCVTGLAASGKSTFAEALAAAAGRDVLSSDRVRKLRAGVDPFDYAGAEAYGDVESRAVYEELAQRAVTAIRRDGGAIVDATFRRAADADAFVTAARLAGPPAWLVCEAPPAIRLERAAARAAGGSIADAGPTVVASELALHRGPFQAPGRPLARLDTTHTTAELLDRLAAELDARLAAEGESAAGTAGFHG